MEAYFKLATLCVALALVAPSAAFAAAGTAIPEAKVENLNKTKMVVPKDFTAERNVLLFSFGRDMQAAVDAWDAALTPDRNGTTVQVYNMPLIPNPGAIVRGFISGGMRSIYPDKAIRDRVVVMYVDEDKYFPAIGITNKTMPLILVTDKAGVELGRVQSNLSDSALAELRALLVPKAE
jgi:hypothetical protein